MRYSFCVMITQMRQHCRRLACFGYPIVLLTNADAALSGIQLCVAT